MNQEIKFENHFSPRVMEILFPNGFSIDSAEALAHIKREWMGNLKHWHSPYTCLLDMRKLVIAESQRAEFQKLVKFFSNFFMRKTIGFVEAGVSIPEGFDFEIVSGYEEALAKTPLGRQGGALGRNLDDLRSRIQIDNDFNAHVMEITFLADTRFETAKDIDTLKSKVQNILMMWHTPYSIIFNCRNMSFAPEAKEAFVRFEKFVRGFFCKSIVGYAPIEAKDTYPFTMYRARHQAAATLDHSGLQSGAEANCATKLTPVK